MPVLDPRTLIAMAGVMSLLMALVLGLMRRSYPPSIRGLDMWAVAPLLWVVATVLFSARGMVPDALGILTANSLLLLGAICQLVGTWRFLGHPVSWKPWLALFAVTVCGMWLLTVPYPHYAMRVGLFTLSVACIYGSLLVFLLRRGDQSFPIRLVEAVLVLHLLVLAGRLYTLATGQGGNDLMDRNPIQTLYVSAYVLTTLMLPLGNVLMATDRLRAELEHLATQDPLLPVLNRRAFLQACENELSRARRNGVAPALILMDLAHFKAVNDTHGHQQGDAVLRHVVECLQSVLRRADVLARYGGEEFALLLPETGADDAYLLAQRLHACLAQGHPLDCRVSMGATAWRGGTDNLDAMLARADAALCRAKDAGRNQTCIG